MNVAATPHAPFAANVSFDFGPPGAPAGFAIPARAGASAQDVFVGCRPSPSDSWRLLPFYSASASLISPLPRGRFGRFLSPASDKWMIGPLVFKLCTPFDPSAEGVEVRFRYAPLVCGYLEYDNSHSTAPAELVFGVSGHNAAALDGRNGRGFTFDRSHGYVTAHSPEVIARTDPDLLGTPSAVSALHFLVPPQSRRIYPLVLGFFQPGFYYSDCFTDLPDALDYGLCAHARFLALAEVRDAEFMSSGLPPQEKARVADEIRDWLARSRRMAGEPEIDLAPLRDIWRRLAG